MLNGEGETQKQTIVKQVFERNSKQSSIYRKSKVFTYMFYCL